MVQLCSLMIWSLQNNVWPFDGEMHSGKGQTDCEEEQSSKVQELEREDDKAFRDKFRTTCVPGPRAIKGLIRIFL